MAQFELSAESLGLTAEDLGIKTVRSVLAEFIATLLFVFVGAGSVVVVTGVLGLSPARDAAALVAIALAHGLAIATLVAATAKISGGHINPAVTFAAVITGRMKVVVEPVSCTTSSSCGVPRRSEAPACPEAAPLRSSPASPTIEL